MITKNEMERLIAYDPDTGSFTWRVTLSARAQAGKIAGSVTHNGYILICICGHKYRAHHLAWVLIHSVWPHEIDHINGDRADNRIANLREATRSQNNYNSKHRKDNTSGVRGVWFHNQRRKWTAMIMAEGKRRYLGLHPTKELATAAYAEAAEALHGEYRR